MHVTLLTDGAQWIPYYGNINAAAVDAIIAGALCYLLARCRTGYTKYA